MCPGNATISRMPERTPETNLEKWEPIVPGCVVMLKKDIHEDVVRALAPHVVPDTPYLVFRIDEESDGNHGVWIGPKLDAEYDKFVPMTKEDPLFGKVFSLSVHHLRRVPS